jgi:hypothetical protein
MQLMHPGSAAAADECLAGPRGESPAGHHWFYRVDRSTKRHCWYLGERGRAVSRDAGSTSKRAALFARLRRENAQPGRADDAHAELAQARVEDTLRADDTLLTTPIDRKRLVAARSTQDLPEVATGQDMQSVVATRWPNLASVLLPPSGLTNVSLAGALPPPEANGLTPADPEPGTSPTSMDKADAQVASKLDSRAGGRTNSTHPLFWALCGTLVLACLAGGARYFTREGANDAGWSPAPFSMARMTSWVDQAADISARFSSYGRRANLPRQAQPTSRSMT